VATLEVQDGRFGAQTDQLVNPRCAIPPDATAVHGITDAMVHAQPTAESVLPELFSRWENAVLVAHSSPYDEGVLSTEAARSNMWIPPLPILDTLMLSRQLLETQDHYGLEALCKALDIQQMRAHRALSDVLSTAELFLLLVERLRRAGTGRFGDLCRVSNLMRMGTTGRPLQGLPPHLILLRPGLLSHSDVEIHYRKDGRTSIFTGTLDCGYRHGRHDYVELRDHRQRGKIWSLRLDHVDALRPLPMQ
jgi:DNA polymerase III epsilon subunit-like protein